MALSALPVSSLNLMGAKKVGAETTQSEVNQKIENFQAQLNDELTKVNAVYAKAQAAQEKVNQSKAKISGLESDIAQTETDVAHLKENVAHQMRAMQSSGGVGVSVVDVVASSKDLSDMVMRLSNLNAVMSAEAKQAKTLAEKESSLKTMKTSLERSQTKLVENQANYQTQVESLQGDIAGLKEKINTNQKLLSEMKAKAAAEQKAHDEALAKSVAQAKAQAKAEKAAQAKKAAEAKTAATSAKTEVTVPSSSSSTSESSTTQSSTATQEASDDTTKPDTQTPVTPSTGGKTISVEATAYALNGTTAMGIDLSQNPMCIAVDPSVIPLGSMVEVPGYGIAIAGDTGGAIVGNIIDVHFPTNAQAVAWGRQQLQVTILN